MKKIVFLFALFVFALVGCSSECDTLKEEMNLELKKNENLSKELRRETEAFESAVIHEQRMAELEGDDYKESDSFKRQNKKLNEIQLKLKESSKRLSKLTENYEKTECGK